MHIMLSVPHGPLDKLGVFVISKRSYFLFTIMHVMFVSLSEVFYKCLFNSFLTMKTIHKVTVLNILLLTLILPISH